MTTRVIPTQALIYGDSECVGSIIKIVDRGYVNIEYGQTT